MAEFPPSFLLSSPTSLITKSQRWYLQIISQTPPPSFLPQRVGQSKKSLSTATATTVLPWTCQSTAGECRPHPGRALGAALAVGTVRPLRPLSCTMPPARMFTNPWPHLEQKSHTEKKQGWKKQSNSSSSQTQWSPHVLEATLVSPLLPRKLLSSSSSGLARPSQAGSRHFHSTSPATSLYASSAQSHQTQYGSQDKPCLFHAFALEASSAWGPYPHPHVAKSS